MADILSAKDRSLMMSKVKSKNTRPEMFVKSVCRRLGYKGYRIHRKDLPGKPDIAFVGRKLAIFINGCFWHGHDCRGKIRLPKTKRDYWVPKIEKNISRDAENIHKLNAMGWRVLILWECESKNPVVLEKKLLDFLENN